MLSPLRFLPVLLLALTLSAPVPAQESKSAQAAKLAAKLQPFVDSHTLAGAVLLVANRDGVLATETVGSADIASGKPMRPDNVFWIASMSKPVTATALMLLIDEGKVALDDPVEKYLPEFKNLWLAVEQDQDHQLLKRPGQKITVRHILSHTSGMPFRSALEQPTLDALPLSVAVRSYAMTPLQFEPTTKYQYSNA
ncbi:MAG TPA: serine hydrolase domain-containing protein, partial [Planctomycetaceae bacterium]|nr:serine hydrolase domain-containing protein [Planctomycetaceae bacterium]